MSELKDDITTTDEKHPLQKLMDHPFLLLILGLIVPILSYTVWGWIELLFIETAALP